MGQDIPEEKKDADNLQLFKEAVDELDKSGNKKEDSAEADTKEAESRIEDIKAHQEVLEKETDDEPSPLRFLRRKELELRGELLEAEKKAEITIADARRKAAKIRSDADVIAADEAKKFFDQEIKKAEKNATEVKESVGDEIKEVTAVGEKNRDKATKVIIKAVTLAE